MALRMSSFFSSRFQSCRMWPIMITSTQGSGSLKKLPGWKRTRADRPFTSTYSSKMGATSGKIETDAGEVRILERDLHDEVALRGAAVGCGLVFGPRKLRGDGEVGAAADAGHGAQEPLEPRGIGVEGGEDILLSRLLALLFARAERSGEVAPMAVEPLVGHLEHAADVGRLVFVEEEVGRGRVGVDSVAAFQEAERHQRVEKVAGRSRMQAEATGQCLRESSGSLASSVKTSISTALEQSL